MFSLFMMTQEQTNKALEQNNKTWEQTKKANMQAIAKMEVQLGQLATSMGRREPGQFPSHTVPNPKGAGILKNQYEVGSSSGKNQREVNMIHTLRSGREVDNRVQKPMKNRLEEQSRCKDKVADKVTIMSEDQPPSYIPKAPYPERLNQPFRETL